MKLFAILPDDVVVRTKDEATMSKAGYAMKDKRKFLKITTFLSFIRH